MDAALIEFDHATVAAASLAGAADIFETSRASHVIISSSSGNDLVAAESTSSATATPPSSCVFAPSAAAAALLDGPLRSLAPTLCPEPVSRCRDALLALHSACVAASGGHDCVFRPLKLKYHGGGGGAPREEH